MTVKTISREVDNLQSLELRIDELLHLVGQLRSENQNLRQQRTQWMQERERLIENYRQARVKIENILERIKEVEEVCE